MKFTTLILLLITSIGVNAAGKTAFINAKVLLEESPQAIVANEKLQKQFGSREKSLRILAGSINEMEQIYQNDSAIMSSEQKKIAEGNIIQNKRRFKFEQQSLKEDLQSRQRELMQKVQISIKAAIQGYGDKNGYDFIFTDSSIAYASDAVDITEQILNELKQ